MSGQTVFVAGGAGSVGFYAVQLARWGGAQVLATVSSDQKARIARDAGANEVINYRSEDVAARVMQLTDRAGVDRVIEVDYAANVATNTAILKQGGVIASYASMSEREPPIPFYQMMQKNLLTRLVFVYEVPKPALAQAASDLNACQKEGSLKHLIDRRFPLNQTAQAHEAVESGQMIGNVVIDI